MLKAYDVHARDTAPRYLHVVSDFGLGMGAWRFLRTWSVDDLPQVINRWKGEMSLLGPRPPLLREADNHTAAHYTQPPRRKAYIHDWRPKQNNIAAK